MLVIYELQGLRALAMLGIFLFHSWLFPGGSLALTFFFMLSGFVTYYSQYKKVDNIKLKDIPSWVFNKIKKLYPIYFITLILSIIIRWNWITTLTLKEFIGKFSLNLVLLQSLFRNEALNFNPLSWFLSVLVIIYVFTIPIMKSVKKISVRNTVLLVLGVILLQFSINILKENIFTNMYLYSNPAYRILEFILGILIAKIYVEKKIEISHATLVEILIGIIFSLQYLLHFKINTIVGISYYNIIFTLAIYIFALGQGRISKLLKIKLLQNLAKISFEFYMIHELILIIFRYVFQNLQFHWILNRIIISIVSFVFSLICAVLIEKYASNDNEAGKLFRYKIKNV